MQTNKQRAIELLIDLRQYIAENNDFPDTEYQKINEIISFINKNL